MGRVLGLLIIVVITPPMMDMTPKAVWGINCPKMEVAPIKGAHSSQIRAQTIVEKAHIRFLSAETNSVVHVVRMAKVLEMAIFVPIPVCNRIINIIINYIVWSYIYEIPRLTVINRTTLGIPWRLGGMAQMEKAKMPPRMLKMPLISHFLLEFMIR